MFLLLGGYVRCYLLMMPKSSPVRCTILALVAVAYKREQHRIAFEEALVWGRPNTLRKLSQKCFYNSRVLVRSYSRVPFYEDVGAFYSSEALPPFLVEQVFSWQSKSSPCRASLILAEQVFSLQSKFSPCRVRLILAEQVFSLQSKFSRI